MFSWNSVFLNAGFCSFMLSSGVKYSLQYKNILSLLLFIQCFQSIKVALGRFLRIFRKKFHENDGSVFFKQKGFGLVQCHESIFVLINFMNILLAHLWKFKFIVLFCTINYHGKKPFLLVNIQKILTSMNYLINYKNILYNKSCKVFIT